MRGKQVNASKRRNQTNIFGLNGSSLRNFFTGGSYSTNKNRGWFKKFSNTIGTNRASTSVSKWRGREREKDREIGESETNIFRPKRTIHLGSKVTLSSSGNL